MTRWGLGIAGWGNAGAQMAAAGSIHGQIGVTAVAEPDESRRSHAASAGIRTFPGLEQMLASPEVDIVYVATPTPLHVHHVRAAIEAKKHVIVEKPMATSINDALACCDLATVHDVALIVGSTHSFNAPVRLLRQLVQEQQLGALVAVSSLCRTDWLDRPRSPADLRSTDGGGIVMRQGAHQFDMLRFIVGSPARNVYGTVSGPGEGRELGYSAMVQFDGVAASATYAGVGGFDSRLLTLGVGELGETRPIAAPLRDYFARANNESKAAPMFGHCIATFEDGEAVSTPYGALVFRHGGAEEVFTPRGWNSGWLAVLDEMTQALAGEPAIHDGYWGVATLEICAAVHLSSRNGIPVRLHHQQARRSHAATPEGLHQ